MKTKDFEFIQKFNQINITNIAKKLNIPLCNVSSARISAERMKKVRDEIIKEFCVLIIDEMSDENEQQ